MKKHLNSWLLILIVCLAATLRLWQITDIPAILNRDEAALAYNAYLLKETGLDEWQRRWPLALESFGDYKLPGYPALLVILFATVGDWQDWLVRLPAVMAGTGLVIVSYFLAKQWGFSKHQALLTAGLIAFQPHFIFYSRIGYEAVVGLFIFLLALLALSYRKTVFLLQLSLVVFLVAAASLTYNTPLLLLPFCLLLIPLWQGLRNWQRWLVFDLVLVAVFVVIWTSLSSLTTQKSGITVFSDELTRAHYIEYRSSLSGLALKVFGNKHVYYLSLITANLAESFSAKFLVTDGGSHPWHSLPNWGHLWWLVYGLGIIGLLGHGGTVIGQLWLTVIKPSFKHKHIHWPTTTLEYQLALMLLTLSSLAPSVITVDSPHTTRSLLFLLLWVFWAVQGVAICRLLIMKLVDIFIPQNKKANQQTKQHAFYIGVIVLLLWGVFEFGVTYYNYFIYYPAHYSESLRVGYDKVIREAAKRHPHQPIAVVDPAGFHYILTSWYTQMAPETYFSTIIRQQPDQIGFRYGQQVGNYHFIGRIEDRNPQTEKVVILWNIDTQSWEIKEL